MRVLVTGCAGRVGTAVVDHLVGRGFDVRGIDVEQPVDEQIDFRVCDLMTYEAIGPHLQEVDVVLHLAAIPAPGRGPNDQIFSLNCAGTFNVFTACADAGVGRMVVASSINAIGYFFGTEPFEIDYLPVDEGHPKFTTDAYSFSKQVTEDIGAYFWRRDRISNTCLRFGAGLQYVDEMREAQGEAFRAARSRVGALASLNEEDADEQVRVMRATYDKGRRDRTFETDRKFPEMDAIDHRLATMRQNYFSFVDLREACRGMELALTAQYEGSHPLFIVDRQNILCEPADRLVELFYPEVSVRGDLAESQSLVDWRKAEQLIGFVSQTSAQSFYTEAL